MERQYRKCICSWWLIILFKRFSKIIFVFSLKYLFYHFGIVRQPYMQINPTLMFRLNSSIIICCLVGWVCSLGFVRFIWIRTNLVTLQLNLGKYGERQKRFYGISNHQEERWWKYHDEREPRLPLRKASRNALCSIPNGWSDFLVFVVSIPNRPKFRDD